LIQVKNGLDLPISDPGSICKLLFVSVFTVLKRFCSTETLFANHLLSHFSMRTGTRVVSRPRPNRLSVSAMILISLIYAHYWSLLVPIIRSVHIGISEGKTAIVGNQDRLEVKKIWKKPDCMKIPY
jgi:ubiquitin C-terminal hydrolase